MSPGTSLADAQANVLASVTAECGLLNSNLKTIYLDAFAGWVQSVQAGRVSNANPPQPPASYVVAYYDDPTRPGTLWAYPAQTGSAVCPLPPVPDNPPARVTVPSDDTMPVGSRVTGPDGGVWEKIASPTPFGVACYYAKVA